MKKGYVKDFIHINDDLSLHNFESKNGNLQ